MSEHKNELQTFGEAAARAIGDHTSQGVTIHLTDQDVVGLVRPKPENGTPLPEFTTSEPR